MLSESVSSIILSPALAALPSVPPSSITINVDSPSTYSCISPSELIERGSTTGSTSVPSSH
jgi:hypothetical protein